MRARISSPNLWDCIKSVFGQSGGIYKVACVRDESSDEVIPLQRLLGEDLEGVLYIGMAESFLKRVIELKKSVSPEYRSRSHECGVRLKEHAAIAKAFPYQRLVVSLMGSESPRKTETEALQEYFANFGELPPLNRAG